MNERIKELAEQANAFARETVEYHRGDDFSEFTDKLYTVSREKFAELIVRECVEVCKKQEYKYWRSLEEDQWTPIDSANAIQEHFGVGE